MAEEKQRLRKEILARRRGLEDGDVARWSAKICEEVLCLEIGGDVRCIGGYWPMGKEVDLRVALKGFFERGVEVGLPVVRGRSEALGFRRWVEGCEMERRALGVMEPTDAAPWCLPEVLLVPLLAFDRRGHRLGYGAGFYDRTIESFRARGEILTVGIAFGMQECAEVPIDGRDQPLDWVLTEGGLLRMSEARDIEVKETMQRSAR